MSDDDDYSDDSDSNESTDGIFVLIFKFCYFYDSFINLCRYAISCPEDDK